ncbi:protein kinase family protein [Rhodococcus erythropolis]|nr:protein kinase family protein [Rhodococcus erythropolis]
MKSVEDLRIQRLLAEYDSHEIDLAYLALYQGAEERHCAFASIHQRLDVELQWMNTKARNGQSGHFNADNSRSLLNLIDEVAELTRVFAKSGVSVTISSEYDRVLTESKAWLVDSGGSPIPEGFTPIVVEKYEQIFSLDDVSVKIKTEMNSELKLVGQGAFANVHSFVDPNYGIRVARKKLRKGADEREIQRFRQEFDLLKELSFPYILQAYKFSEDDNSYTMEFCDQTLGDYIGMNNNTIKFHARKRIALQFLYGLNYLHSKGHVHRDLSYNNVLVRVYDAGAVIIKLSDFGLVKKHESEFTMTETQLKGTIRDPAVENFQEFGKVNDIYAVGYVLSFIFKGQKRVISEPRAIGEIVQKCAHSDPSHRYQDVLSIIQDIENIEFEPEGETA